MLISALVTWTPRQPFLSQIMLQYFFLKMGHSRPLFLYFRLSYKQLTVNKCSIKVANDWIRTRVLWYWKRPLCQLRHNHCPNLSLVISYYLPTHWDFNMKLLVISCFILKSQWVRKLYLSFGSPF